MTFLDKKGTSNKLGGKCVGGGGMYVQMHEKLYRDEGGIHWWEGGGWGWFVQLKEVLLHRDNGAI